MTSRPSDDAPDSAPLTLAEAAVLLSSGDGAAGERLRWAVEAQLVRRGVSIADRDDVRADVALALLVSTRTQSLTLAAAAAHAARVARNKSIDHHRRRLREAPEEALADRAAWLPDGSLQVGLDAVSGEVHRRDVSSALVDLVRELPRSERLALTATATGAGHLGSGLGRSSHYRALDRARLRLAIVVRSRVAGGLALPAILYRTVGHARALLLPLGATAAAGIASIALVLPAVETPAAAIAAPAVSARLAQGQRTVTVRMASVAPRQSRFVQRRAGTTTRVVVATPRAATVRSRPLQTLASVAHADPVPAAGLDPCRAAQLCQ